MAAEKKNEHERAEKKEAEDKKDEKQHTNKIEESSRGLESREAGEGGPECVKPEAAMRRRRQRAGGNVGNRRSVFGTPVGARQCPAFVFVSRVELTRLRHARRRARVPSRCRVWS